MEHVKLLLLSMSLIAGMTVCLAADRRHGRRLQFSLADTLKSSEVMGGDDRYPIRDRRHGRGLHGLGVERMENIPGFPMKGPPSAPFVFPVQNPPRGPGPMGGGVNFHGPMRDFHAGPGNLYPPNNFPPRSPNAGPHYSLNTNNFPTNGNSGNELVPGNSNEKQWGRQDNFQDRPPRQQFPRGPFKPDNINNAPALQPVTNELPTTSTTTTTNPREFDLLYGSNLRDASNSQPQQPEGKSLDVDPDIGTRILLDSPTHCKAGFILVNDKCRPKV